MAKGSITATLTRMPTRMITWPHSPGLPGRYGLPLSSLVTVRMRLISRKLQSNFMTQG